MSKKTNIVSEFELPKDIDLGILDAVLILNKHGFKTFESCQGGKGHAFFEPTIRFEGTEFDLIRAYEICELYKLPVFEIKRVFRKTPIYTNSNEQIGEVWECPFNEITFISLEQNPISN